VSALTYPVNTAVGANKPDLADLISTDFCQFSDRLLATMAPNTASLIERDGYALVRNATAGEIWPIPAKPDRPTSTRHLAAGTQMGRFRRMMSFVLG
jgi:hypothetical protein